MLRRCLFTLIALGVFAVPVAAQAPTTARLSAANQCVTHPVTGMGTGVWDVRGTFSGTVSFTVALGGNFNTIDVFAPDTPGTATNSTVDTPGAWSGSVAGYQTMRACMTSYASGAADITLSASPGGGGGGGGGSVTLEGDIMAGAQPADDPHFVRCSDGSVAAACVVNLTHLAGNSVSAGVGASGTGTLRTAALIHDGTDTAQVVSTDGGTLQVIDATAGALLFAISTATGLTASGLTTTQTDNLATTTDGHNSSSFTYVYDGTNLDLLRVGPAGTAASTVLTIQGIASMTPVQIADNGGAITVDGFPTTVGTAVAIRCVNTAGDTFEACGGNSAVPVDDDDGDIAGAQEVGINAALLHTWDGDSWIRATADTQAIFGGAATWTDGTTPTGGYLFGRASAAAPTNVAGDDAVVPWMLLSGATATQPTFGGVLAVAGNGASGTGVQRVTMANDSTGILAQVTLVPTVTSITGFNSTTMTLNAGAAAAGTPRVIIANDDDVSDAATLFEAALLAHDAPDAGSSLPVGFRAIAHGTNPTAVAAADRTVAYANRAGVPFMIGGHPNVITETVQVTDADGAQTGTAIATCGAGCKFVVTRASVKCSNANTVNVDFRLVFDTDTTLAAQAEAGLAGEITAFDDIPPGGGSSEGDGSGILGVGADNEDLVYAMTDPVTGSCTASVSYYTIES